MWKLKCKCNARFDIQTYLSFPQGAFELFTEMFLLFSENTTLVQKISKKISFYAEKWIAKAIFRFHLLHRSTEFR